MRARRPEQPRLALGHIGYPLFQADLLHIDALVTLGQNLAIADQVGRQGILSEGQGGRQIEARRKETAIADVEACEVLDSRGRPTVWCEVALSGGARGSASVPSGASTSAHERRELRDGAKRYRGRGVLRAVANVEEVLGSAVQGLDAYDQQLVDETLVATDGTADLSRLGANAVLAVSVATALAAANASGVPFYRHQAQRLGGEPLLPPGAGWPRGVWSEASNR
jgi:hypothetical protein